jgi:hypothetical protein
MSDITMTQDDELVATYTDAPPLTIAKAKDELGAVMDGVMGLWMEAERKYGPTSDPVTYLTQTYGCLKGALACLDDAAQSCKHPN